MTKTRLFLVSTAAFLSLVFIDSQAMASETRTEAPRMTIEQLKEMLENPDLVILDVRVGLAVKTGLPKIEGAIRKAPKKAPDWGAELDKNKTYVLYCT